MTFAEKLVFLMQLTSTSNKHLAEAVKVDPSLISLLRTGRRDAPRNTAHIKAMAAYFSKKIEGNYQRIALSEALGRKHLQILMDTDQLAGILLEWLTDGSNQVGQFLNTFERFSLESPDSGTESNSEEFGQKMDLPNSAYYGNEGKRGAVKAFLDFLISRDTPGTILFSTDESFDWLYEDSKYLSQLKEGLLILLQRGFRVCRIASPIYTTEQAFDSMAQLIPLYLTGQVESYYYPRLRDNVFRRTFIILPETAAVISNSLNGQPMSRATIFIRDKRLTSAYAAEFKDFLSRCLPMMTTYSTAGSADELLRCISQFESDKGNRIQQSISLSSISSPPELIVKAVEGLPAGEAATIVDSLTRSQQLFRQSLEEYEIIDIHSIATAKEVRAGTVQMSNGYLSQQPPICYTPETYVMHLQSILELMEQYENYCAVLRPRDPKNHSLMVKDGRQAILLRPDTPLTVFEVSQPNIAEACREYLMRIIKSNYTPEMQRQNTMSQLRQLISELSRE